ncbi:hypothetical protein [Aerococcus suis]|uniref:Uncharacterized protein n=1 Tax=Aerococcus suis TaxID=371602 RepID=A0A1W1Y3F0_9LACT|nr:hypothetical protein [Aerococcus suis]MCI7239719.1 hypothetical protein [Aerococcus suis]MDD7758144.1 hypothetical protein [Aerococcus suis]MDY4646605.1 hypothetical protein [Aerococcus suis]SMC30657.1 hypothetical protein SAMN04487984_0239 [Aerococcus suis]
MKRRTYREWKKYMEATDKRHTSSHLANQDTTEYSKAEFRDIDSVNQNINLLDTNEIYFKEQKDKQWQWSNPKHPWRLVIGVILVIIAIILLVVFGHTVITYLR